MAPQTSFLAGMPVAVDPAAIEQELARLWKPQEPDRGAASAVARACLSNVIAFLPDAAAQRWAEDRLPGVGQRFPSRFVLLLLADRSSATPPQGGTGLEAAVSAICYVGAQGGSRVCCEQISLRSSIGERGEAIEQLATAAVSLLVPDVPVNLLLPRGGDERLLDELGSVVDRVVHDSRQLGVSPRSLATLLDAFERSRKPTPCEVDDLAWRAITRWRRNLCDIFEDVKARAILREAHALHVVHAAGSAASGALLAGWIASRLESGGRRLSVRLEARPASGDAPAGLLAFRLEGAEGSFLAIDKPPQANCLRLEYCSAAACVLPHTLPWKDDDEAELLGAALERSTHQGVFASAMRRAVEIATDLR